ncbi:MAG TPA: hypothetical protein PLL10_00210 [Elusimicrobiales bacterium]|nr:hypothetical protein [Elusimicrobiales bacterium]
MDEPDTDNFTDAEIVQACNLEFADLADEFRTLGQNYFAKTWVAPIVTTAVEYWMPFDAATIRSVEYLESSAVSGTAPFYIVNPEKGSSELDGYTINGQRLVFDTPVTSAGYIRVNYWQDAPPLHDGQAQAGATSSITLATTAVNGSVLTQDNCYYGLAIYLYGGTGAGQRRWITQYNGATKVASIDSAWATTPDVTTEYSLEAPFGDSFQEMIALGAVMRLKGITLEDDASPAARLYAAKMERLITIHGRRHNRRVLTRG